MRTLLLLRGTVDKSTWIRENNLSNYTLSFDNIRLLYQSPRLNSSGDYEISLKNDNIYWEKLLEILEYRMSYGEFTVIDANHSKISELYRYKDLSDKYGYKVFCIDFSDDNKNKHKISNNVMNIPAPYIQMIKPNELDKVWYKKENDYTDIYDNIYVIGDIHGCFNILIKALTRLYHTDNVADIIYRASKDKINKYKILSELLDNNSLYIFCGDYIDRGIENAEVINFLLEIYNRPNVVLIEGNHEIWLKKWTNDKKCESKEFNLNTKKQLESNNRITKKKVQSLCNSLVQCAYFDYYSNTYIITHGGLSTIPENLTFVSTEQMIKGVGKRKEYIDCYKTFEEKTKNNVYQIHGHRNTDSNIFSECKRSMNLEGAVEFGGYLRIIRIVRSNRTGYTFKNDVFKK